MINGYLIGRLNCKGVVVINTEEIKFKCKPVHERYYSDTSSFGVFVFHTTDDIPEYDKVPSNQFDMHDENLKMSVLAGNMQHLYLGSEYEVVATLEYNNKYKSYQYKPKTIISLVPKSIEQQKSFLQSIITEKQAESLLNAYPNIVDDIINKRDKVDVRNIKGIGDKTYKAIKEKVIENYVISDILILLQPLGVTYNKIKKLLMNEPNPILLKQKLIDDPYIMLKIKGFGFKTVDQLALKINPDIKVSDKRTIAFVKYYLKEIGNNHGHTYIQRCRLNDAVRDNINECYEEYEKLISREEKNEWLLHFKNDYVGLRQYYEIERDIIDILKELNKYDKLELSEKNIKIGIEESNREQGFDITDEQKDVVLNSLNDNVCVITGAAGTGKTTISRTLLNIYKNKEYSIACCALSAKAAQRITEATGFQASTIHRLLGYNNNGFNFNSNHRLLEDIVLIDEASMINAQLFYDLLSAIKPGAKVIICGDDKQLPPIGFGNVFGDLLKKKDLFSISKLTKVLRQAEKSGILMDANKIRNGKFPIEQPELRIVNGELNDMTYMFRDTRDGLRNIAINTFMKSIEQDGLDECVIITPRRDNCDNSAAEINKKIVEIIFDKSKRFLQYGDKKYYIGAKVMQMDNNYEKNVFNGEMGYITKIEDKIIDDKKETVFDVEFKMNGNVKTVTYKKNELDQIDLAYACTCHKMQGSGFKTVIIIIDMTHYTLLDSCMLYTAITRAKKRCLLLSEPNAFQMCMTNNKSKDRQTWMSMMR